MGEIHYMSDLNATSVIFDHEKMTVTFKEHGIFERIDDYTRSQPTSPSPGRVYRKNLGWPENQADHWVVYVCKRAPVKEPYVDHIPYKPVLPEEPRVKFSVYLEGAVPKDLVNLLNDLHYESYSESPSRIRVNTDDDGRTFLQWQVWRKDSYTGEYAWGAGGKAYVSPHAIPSEIVQMVFGLAKAYEEHEVREAFSYRGRRVFSPHHDVELLWEIADRTVTRPKTVDQHAGVANG